MAKRFIIGNCIRELREAGGGVTQSELGNAVGVTRQTIAAIEQAKYAPSLETAFRIARYFQISVEDVFYWDE